MLLACLEISAELVVILGNACASVRCGKHGLGILRNKNENINHFYSISFRQIYATMLPIVLDASVHSSVDVRLAAALCLRNLVEVVPARAANVISQVHF